MLSPAISARTSPTSTLVLCVMTGGVIFCGHLLPKLDFPLDFDYLDATVMGLKPRGQDSLACGAVDAGEGAHSFGRR